ncbi:MAG: hypothetical protein U1E67_12245 [Hyphomicrobiales bacterium]
MNDRAVGMLRRHGPFERYDLADACGGLLIAGLRILARRHRTGERAHDMGQEGPAFRRMQGRGRRLAEIIENHRRLAFVAGEHKVVAAAAVMPREEKV